MTLKSVFGSDIFISPTFLMTCQSPINNGVVRLIMNHAEILGKDMILILLLTTLNQLILEGID
ncbi:hypothetical protein GCM10008924_28760 [Gracilibacillus halotolerans]